MSVRSIKCECKSEDSGLDETNATKESNTSETTVPISEVLDFGRVTVGKRTSKVFKIKNTSTISQEYVVVYNPDTNPLYRTFDASWNQIVERGESFECKITYTPLFPFEVNIDYLHIYEKSNDIYTLSLKGESVGPRVEVSTKHLKFFAHRNRQSVKQTFEIRNTGNAKVTYQFDLTNLKIGLYSINRNRGTIPANKCDFIDLTFNPKQYGIYNDAFSLLVLHHKPYIIELLGVYTEDQIPEDAFIKHYCFDVKGKTDYSGYLYDCMTLAKNPPPISLSENYLNFEGVNMDENNEKSKTLVTSLTNHMWETIEVEWNYDTSNAFAITPKRVRIPGQNSMMFDCKFAPTVADQFYHEIVSGNVYWVDERKNINDLYTNAPIPIYLRLFANSFPSNRKWIPQLIVPDTVILPACVPDSTSCSTFMLKLNGYLPVSYRFVPPTKSRFILKPMMGIVDDYQIIVAFIQCNHDNKQAYVERWGVELNGQASDYRWIYIKAFCEEPIIVVGSNNVVTFPPVHPQCQEFEVVPIQNKSIHCIKYKFHLNDNHGMLHIDHPEGRLASNEIINLYWTITGKVHLPRVYVIICEIRTANDNAISGKNLDFPVKIHAVCTYSELCSMPSKCNFRQIEVGATHTFRFNLFNFGQSCIHYKLVYWDREKSDFDDRCLSVIPSQGTLLPKENHEIRLCLHCNMSGNFNVAIYYQTRLNRDSLQVVDGDNLKKVFSFKFKSTYPSIQIIDINVHNFGPLFSKATLWQILNINKINYHLKTMKLGETRTMNIFLPDSQFTRIVYVAVLVLRNNSLFDTFLKLKRNKICNCPLKETKGLTMRKLIFECPHRELFSMKLSGEILQANANQKLKISARYLEPGTMQMSYFFILSHSRTLKCNIFLHTLADNVAWPSKYMPFYHMRLGTFSVLEKNPPAQAFWLYNNSSNLVTYHLNTHSSDDSTWVHDFEVLHCFNPEGNILPFSSKPILFKFQPLEYKIYHFTFPLKLGHDHHTFTMCGYGDNGYRTGHQYLPYLPIQINVDPIDEIMFSEEYIFIAPFLVWSETETVIFIKNLSKSHTLGYEFERSFIEGFVDINVFKPQGMLDPRESHMVRILIKSFNEACKLKMHLTCKLLNYTQYCQHTQSSLMYALREEQIKDEFIITETGTSHVPNEVIVEVMPSIHYKTITLDIKIVNVNNVDMLEDNTRTTQYPQHTLDLDEDTITKALRPTRTEGLTKNLHTDKQPDVASKNTVNAPEKMKIENVEMIKDAIDCIIMSVLQSKAFYELIEKRQSLPPPYYIQFISDESVDCEQEFDERKKEIEDSVKIMQAPLTVDIFKKLIDDSLHEVFQLGSKIESSHLSDLCNTEKCKICTERHCLNEEILFQ